MNGPVFSGPRRSQTTRQRGSTALISQTAPFGAFTMAGINIIFDRNEYIDHGRYNAPYYNEDPQSSWAYMVRIVEVPMKGLQ